MTSLLVIVAFILDGYSLVTVEMIEIKINGRGLAHAFPDGHAHRIRSIRNDPSRLFTFETEDGLPFPLMPGNSWTEIVGSSSEIVDYKKGGLECVFPNCLANVEKLLLCVNTA